MTNTWKKGEMTLTFYQPTITPHDEDETVSDLEDVMYFYYHVLVKHNKKELLNLDVHEFPKVQKLPLYIDEIMNMDMSKAYLLEDTIQGDFRRKIRYHQIVFNDGFGLDYDYFYKFERYDYEITHGNETNAFTEYHLTIGEMAQNQQYGGANREDFGLCVMIKDINPDELIALKETALAFCQKAMDEYNQSISTN